MTTDPAVPSDWFLLAANRMEKADALHPQFGPSCSGVELLHEATERYLKGDLVGRGWQLVKTQDLNRLLAEACYFNEKFAQFAVACQNLNEQFWEQHYPGGDLDDVGEGYDEFSIALDGLIKLIMGDSSR